MSVINFEKLKQNNHKCHVVDFSSVNEYYNFTEEERKLMLELIEVFGSFKRVKNHIIELEIKKHGY